MVGEKVSVCLDKVGKHLNFFRNINEAGETMNYSRLFSFFIMLALSAVCYSDDGPTDYDGINLNVLGAMQYEVCQLNPGMDLEDADRQTKLAGAEFARLDLDLGIITFTPFYDHADAVNTTADYITMVYGSIPAMGEAWDKWEQSEGAAKVMKGRDKVGKCHFKFNYIDYKYMDVEQLENSDRRVVQTEWCTRRPGVSKDDLAKQHKSWLAETKEKSNFIGWAIIHPRLGQGNAPGDFFHFFIYDSVGDLMKDEEWLANGGGMQGADEYYNSYVDCGGPSVWSGTIAQRPSN